MTNNFADELTMATIVTDKCDLKAFLTELTEGMPDGTAPIFCAFPEAPDDQNAPKWRWKGSKLNLKNIGKKPRDENLYITISSFINDKRRIETFAACLGVMIDDIGTKVPFSKITLEPTIKVETSKGNWQYWYKYETPVTDARTAEGVINALVSSGLMDGSKDPGMKGLTRYGRPPGGYNNKSTYGEVFRTHAVWGKGRPKYTVEELCSGFNIVPEEVEEHAHNVDYKSGSSKTALMFMGDPIGRFINQAGLVKYFEAGVVEVTCPWEDEHSTNDDATRFLVNGDGSIGFKCHHGHCCDRNMSAVWEWARENGLDDASEKTAIEASDGGDEWSEPEESLESKVNAALSSDSPDKAVITLKAEQPHMARIIDQMVELYHDEENREIERGNAVHRLSNPERDTLKLYTLIDDEEFVGAMYDLAGAMPTAVEFIYTPMVAVLASRMGTKHDLVVKRSSGQRAKPIFWTMVVGNTGDMKSPTIKAATRALYSLENKARESWDKHMRVYNDMLPTIPKGAAIPEPPILKRYVVDDATPQVRTLIHQENPTGLLFVKEEASRFLSELNRFSNGGGELETALSEFDGEATIVDRKGSGGGGREHLYLNKTAVQRTGGTQVSTLKELMGGHNDSRGFWARWLFCAVPTPIPYASDEDSEEINPLPEMVEDILETIESFPAKEYGYSTKARKLAIGYQNELTRLGFDSDDEAERNAYPKLKTYLHRFALFYHILNAAVAGELPGDIVKVESVKRAIHTLKFFQGQLQTVLNLNSPERALTGESLALLASIQKKGPSTARELQMRRVLNKFGLTKSQDYKERLTALIEAGRLKLDGKVYTEREK